MLSIFVESILEQLSSITSEKSKMERTNDLHSFCCIVYVINKEAGVEPFEVSRKLHGKEK
jgi:hypothetical protein